MIQRVVARIPKILAAAAGLLLFGAAAWSASPVGWESTGNGLSEQHYSPLDQINDSNVGQLGLAWYADVDTDRGTADICRRGSGNSFRPR